jgi:hypothetical protein
MSKFILALVTLLVFSSCKKDKFENSNAIILDYTGTDGCSLVIQLDNGSILEPSKLPENVQLIPNRRVEVKYRIVNGFSVCMMGSTAEIHSLRYL